MDHALQQRGHLHIGGAGVAYPALEGTHNAQPTIFRVSGKKKEMPVENHW